MSVEFRTYDRESDFDRVGRFLAQTYRTSGGHINWLQPRWEYMHFHPLIKNIELDSIGMWEADGEIVAVVHPEHAMGEAYFEVHPGYEHLKVELLAFAEKNISSRDNDHRRLEIWIIQDDHRLQQIASVAGYEKAGRTDPMAFLDTADLPSDIGLPAGFSLKSLAEDNDVEKVHRLLWRGFGHGNEPEPDGIMVAEERKLFEKAPNYCKDLNVIIVAPNGNFVSYCGMWFEPVHRVAYVEPVATDPDYRRMGLGRAAVLEGIRRCAKLGALVACVGSTMPFYQSMGFKRVYASELWAREWK